MRYLTLDVKNSGSMEYAALYLYLIDDSPDIDIRSRPVVVVCPGGGYAFTSDREAEIVALQFLAMGYHAAVLRYSVAPAVFPTAVLELGSALAQLRQHGEEWHIRTDRIVVAGFSAGGHMAAGYCMFWNREWMGERLGVRSEMLRPNGMILGYPVITSGKYGHQDSFRCLLAGEYEEKKGELSLEHCVGEQVPRAFVWHTWEDDGVPVQNSLLLVSALTEHHIPVEFHMFEKGGHGLSLANRLTNTRGHGPERAAETWISLVRRWMENGLD